MGSSIPNIKVHSKINERVNKLLYNWNLQHPRGVQTQIANDFLKVSIGGHSEPQLIPKLLLQMYVQELHNSMVGPPKEGLLK